MFKALLITAAATALAAPTSVQLETRQQPGAPFQQQLTGWNEGAVSNFPIHSSCNSTQRAQIAAGLNETILLAEHAKEHVLRWGNSSELYQKYFGELPPFQVIGAFDLVVSGDKGGVLFRCDDPDNNCHQDGWAGHWRGDNATAETVICDLSYETRRWLNSMCGLGYNIAEGATNTFWASDLLHRLYHMPAFGYGHIEHVVETYDDVIEFAKNNTETNVHDSDVLQYFALDAYAYDIAVPGVGCPGEVSSSESSESATTSSATPSASQASTQTSSAPAVSEEQ
ncbi:Prenylated Rab acceptor protein 1 [Knufia fluminis]|uniref:Prenylated Rab acceptor protein 1 n=1 Tax=Knufia fluminis TaxID=191047 RepID=A0AAN8IRX4_9EURO|nr:Prenylated Rab acceptor protein 1 [Knufia fluminis]